MCILLTHSLYQRANVYDQTLRGQEANTIFLGGKFIESIFGGWSGGGESILYSGKLWRAKTFANRSEVTILRRKLSQIGKK